MKQASLRRVVLVDLDHTVSNSWWRDSLIGGEDGWDAYHQGLVHDAPLPDTIGLVNALAAAGYDIVGITARPEKWRQLTISWMVTHEVMIHNIIMRPDDNYEPANKLKLALALARWPNLAEEVAFIMDDREDIIEAFRGAGVTALQVFGRQN
jgi:phosphoglycolate phosphatase-like HAD superfamily hydrolase